MNAFKTGFGFTLGAVVALIIVIIAAANVIAPGAASPTSTAPPQPPTSTAPGTSNYPPTPSPEGGIVDCYELHCVQRGRSVSFDLAGSGTGPQAGDSCGQGRSWHSLPDPGNGHALYACRRGAAF